MVPKQGKDPKSQCFQRKKECEEEEQPSAPRDDLCPPETTSPALQLPQRESSNAPLALLTHAGGRRRAEFKI
ncbi:hypothetical protein NQZ68_007632 [Dissostichus eleginoides]|nr:hypothetical protein NQZ68_007632 [Dissostichus eleginoides]